MRVLFTVMLLFGAIQPLLGQQYHFTHDDTLRGSITPERAWWDLTFYHLRVRLSPADSTLSGSNEIHYRVQTPSQLMQIDLQRALRITRIEQDGQALAFRQDGDAYFVSLVKKQEKGKRESVTVFYQGAPRVAKKAPWDGGFVYARDASGRPFIATACQGLGASSWWPCKDHPADEPDSMAISITVPKPLIDVSNGQLRKVTENQDNTRTFDWFVANPINNYGVNLNAACYEHWSDTYAGLKGPLALNYYVLPEHLEAAKKQFQQVPLMLKAFEYWFGPYPFYEDGYKLVEVPYLGMEHQSSVTYGNLFKNGYLGRDLSATGWGLKWDFIIVHESGHEWFANSITNKDEADMWVHESFTNYSESLFTEYYYGKEAASAYVIGCRKLIRNDRPVVGTYNVNHAGSGDMYYKGGNMLHMIRQLVNDDEKWHHMLLGLNKTFYHKTVSGAEVEAYMIDYLHLSLQKVFDQYLRDIRIPVLRYRFKNNQLQYQWTNCIAGFDMPVKVKLGQTDHVLKPVSGEWKTVPAKGTTTLTIDPNYYVKSAEDTATDQG